MALFRRRLVFWLVREYIKRWGKVIFISFLLGLIGFFLLIFTSQKVIEMIPFQEKQVIGMVGAYRVNGLPPEILRHVSSGLTIIEEDGTVTPGIAEKWTVTDNGKTYTFTLKDNLSFSDGDPVTAEAITYDFADVTTERPDERTIRYKLKDAYAPFLVTVSRPVFKDGYVGAGAYRIADVELNGGFVKTLQLVSVRNKFDVRYYQFYPSEEALKLAFSLGEVTHAQDLTDTTFNTTSFTEFPNANLEQETNYAKLVTIFFNTNDSLLSDKKIRNALSYALPDDFPYGERTQVSFAPNSQFLSKESFTRTRDLNHAKLLLSSAQEASEDNKPITVTMAVQEKYLPVAKDIAAAWKNVGVATKIEEVTTLPSRFQVYLGDFTLPRDPDQYVLWHSGQPQNITRYKNLRIDKLLEDGRKTADVQERMKIYADFQKYLLDDSPAIFLYFPYSYQVIRG